MDLPADRALRWIVATYARLLGGHGTALRGSVLVQPTGEYFPDEFCADAPSVLRLLRRTMSYSPLAEDLGVELAFLAPEGDHAGGCGSLACGSGGGGGGAQLATVAELEDGYRVFVAATDVGNPDVLAASLARATGALVLHEAGEEDAEDAAVAEIAAVACGLGVLVASGSSVWAKGCGGLRMAQATVLSVEEATVALALFCAVHGVKPSAARAHLGATQREAFDHALAWAESNPYVVESLRDRPAVLEGGLFTLEPVRGILGRWLHKRKLDRELQPQDGAPPAAAEPISEDKRRRLEEARALVDEVLGE
jgi:hypothetical protein